MSQVVINYQNAIKAADSIREIKSQECRVFPGSCDGYFVEAFGKCYRFASIECPVAIADIFKSIVSLGPVESIR